MDYLTYSEKLETIKYLAERYRTGCPKDLAYKLDVSERTALRMVQRLRDMGTPIEFCRLRNSYILKKGCYENSSPPNNGIEGI